MSKAMIPFPAGWQARRTDRGPGTRYHDIIALDSEGDDELTWLVLAAEGKPLQWVLVDRAVLRRTPDKDTP